MIRQIVLLLGAMFGLSISGYSHAQGRTEVAPWVFELKGGLFAPDLDRYKEFYGSDTTALFAAVVAFRPSDWYEIGAELGYLRDSGVGILAGNQTLGGRVKYTLIPAHLTVTAFGRFSPGQWVVPYAGIGATMAWYQQDIEGQPNRSGRTDLGYNAKAGLQLALNRIDRRTAQRAKQSGLIHTYLFVEAQYFSTKADGYDLGGVTYLLGLRMEFDFTD